jgi:hypothetical protein
MKRIAAAAILAVGIGLLAGCAHPKVRLMVKSNKNKGGPDTFVTLAMVDTYCVVTDGVGTLGGRKNYKVYWHVNNGCDSDQYLVFTHYQKYLTDPPDPTQLGPVVTDVVDPDPLYSNKIEKGAADKKFKGEILKANGGSVDDVYKYWICTSPNRIPNPLPDPLPSTIKCLDPDVDIWP